MKQEPKNEIDLLLRQVAQHVGDPNNANGNPGVAEDEHLDADELNAYAENSVPTAARARYTIHLADCTRCRQLVSQLSLATGTVTEEKQSIVPAPSGFRSFLSSLLSPMVLRYAVPALALLVVAFVGLTMFRQSSSFVAMKQEGSGAAQPNASTSPGGVTNSVQGVDENQNKAGKGFADSVTDGRADANAVAKQEKQKENEQPAKKSIDELRTADAPPPASAPEDQSAGASPATVVAREPAPTPTPAAEENKERKTEDAPKRGQATAVGAATETVQVRQEENDKKAKTQPAEPYAIAGNISRKREAPEKSKSETTNARRKSAESDEISARDRADKDDAETRSVAGRHFRKEGSVWIDVAYTSGKRVVNVTRGSDQYRALVADEPEIKTIADQLGGEVIVVWKNQAYRIR